MRYTRSTLCTLLLIGMVCGAAYAQTTVSPEARRKANAAQALARLHKIVDFKRSKVLHPMKIRLLIQPHYGMTNFRRWVKQDTPQILKELENAASLDPANEETRLFLAMVRYSAHDSSPQTRQTGETDLRALMKSAKDERVRFAAGLVLWEEDSVKISDTLAAEVRSPEAVLTACSMRSSGAQAYVHRNRVNRGIVTADKAFAQLEKAALTAAALTSTHDAKGRSGASSPKGTLWVELSHALGCFSQAYESILKFRLLPSATLREKQAAFKARIQKEHPGLVPYMVLVESRSGPASPALLSELQRVASGRQQVDRIEDFARRVQLRLGSRAMSSAKAEAAMANYAKLLENKEYKKCLELAANALNESGGISLPQSRLDAIAAAKAEATSPDNTPWPSPALPLSIYAMTSDSSGDLILMTDRGALYTYRRGAAKPVLLANVPALTSWRGNPGIAVRSRPRVIAVGNKIWASSPKGLVEFDKAKRSTRLHAKDAGFPLPGIFDMVLQGKRLWLLLGGLDARFHPVVRPGYLDTTTGTFTEAKGFHAPSRLAPGRKGELWYTDHGTTVYVYSIENQKSVRISKSSRRERGAIDATPHHVVTPSCEPMRHTGLEIFDIRSRQWQAIEMPQNSYGIRHVVIAGNHAFAASADGMWLVDIAAPKQLKYWYIPNRSQHEVAANHISCIHAVADGLWVARVNGLYFLPYSSMGIEPTAAVARDAPQSSIVDTAVKKANAEAQAIRDKAASLQPDAALNYLMSQRKSKSRGAGHQDTIMAEIGRLYGRQDSEWHEKHMGTIWNLARHRWPGHAELRKGIAKSTSPHMRYIVAYYMRPKPKSTVPMAAEKDTVKKCTECMAICDEAPESPWLAENKVKLFVVKAAAHQALQQYEEALDCYKSGIRFCKDHANREVKEQLGPTLLAMSELYGQMGEAEKKLRILHHLADNNRRQKSAAFNLLKEHYLRTNDSARGLPLLQRFIIEYGHNSEECLREFDGLGATDADYRRLCEAGIKQWQWASYCTQFAKVLEKHGRKKDALFVYEATAERFKTANPHGENVKPTNEARASAKRLRTK